MIGLLLSLAGASISLVLLIIDKKEDKKKRIILTLATTGFLIFFGQQFLNYFSSKASDQIFKNLDDRTKIINTKTTRIDSNISVLQVLISKLDNTSIDKIGIVVKSLDDLENLYAFDKGNPEAWAKYQTWLMTPLNGKKALRFIVNTNRHYNYSLVLLYLMTDRSNLEFVRNTIDSYQNWSKFPQSSDWDLINSSKPLCDLVIFENHNGKIIGFAKAKELLENLYQIKNNQEFEYALNSENGDFENYATNNLTSFQISARGQSIEEVSTCMINENISETVSYIESVRYYLNLSLLFELK
ncbi:MAG: hypothetical protein K8R58_12730 [Bacteroidales bacterium]|nr:hypothetical protein [Bacteroidales bacterium]